MLDFVTEHWTNQHVCFLPVFLKTWTASCYPARKQLWPHERSAQSTCHQRSVQRTCNQRSVQRTCHQRTCHERSVQRTCHERSVQRTCHERSVQRTCHERRIIPTQCLMLPTLWVYTKTPLVMLTRRARTLWRPFTLTAHIQQIHTGSGSYICHFCGIRSNSKWNLEGHLNKHMGIKPHSCQKCQKTFTYQGDLKRHTTTCGVGPIYPCDVCAKLFKSRWYLDAHMNNHSRPTKHMCTICGKSYIHRRSLHNHTKLKHQ